MTLQRLRGPLLLAGLVPALVAALFMAKVVWMLAHDSDGRQRYAAGDYSGAAGEFRTNLWTNHLEEWVAPFNEGTARLAAGSLADARSSLEDALAAAPSEDQCTVRVNLALTHEALGDELVEFRPESAASEWRSGLASLADGDCLDAGARDDEQQADATAIDKRLRAKLRKAEQPEREPKDRGDKDKPDPQERKLEERNDQAADQHSDWDAYREGSEDVPGQGW